VDLGRKVFGRGDGVEQGELLDGALLDALAGRSGEHAVRGAGEDLGGAADFNDGLGRVAERACRVDHVVEEDAAFFFDIADDVHDLALVGLFAALVNDGKAHAHLVGECSGAGDGADVRRDNHHFLGMIELLEIVFDEDRIPQQVVHGDIEEALDLGGMEVHGEHAVSAGGLDHVGDELGRDGVAALGLAVLTGVAEIRDHGRDAARGGTAAGVDHDEQLHEVVVHGLAGGLNQKDVGAADRLVDGDGDFAVSKGRDRAVAKREPQLAADALGKGAVGVGTEYLDVLTMRNHMKLPSLCSSF